MLGAWLADAHWGRYKTILVFSGIYFVVGEHTTKYCFYLVSVDRHAINGNLASLPYVSLYQHVVSILYLQFVLINFAKITFCCTETSWC